jgi:hypothetical protein
LFQAIKSEDNDENPDLYEVIRADHDYIELLVKVKDEKEDFIEEDDEDEEDNRGAIHQCLGIFLNSDSKRDSKPAKN